jgi:hypothetical protein
MIGQSFSYLMSAAMATAVALLATPSYADEPVRPNAQRRGTEIQGRIVKTAPGHVVISTQDQKEVILYTQPETRYVSNGKVVQFSELRPGATITTAYVMDGERYLADTITVGEATSAQPVEQPGSGGAQKAMAGIEGKIVKTGTDQIVVQTTEHGEVTIRTKPGTKYLVAQPIRPNQLQVGSTVTVVYSEAGGEMTAQTVVAASPSIATSPTGSETTVAQANYIDGRVVRIVGTDQLVIAGIDGTEHTVFVDPTTTYMLGGRPVRLTDFQPDVPISMQIDRRGDRRVARRIVGMTALEGQVVRTVGTDQVILRGADGREVPVYVSQDTRYRLSPQGGVFTDLRPGSSVTVFYDQVDRRNRARNIFVPDRRPPRR